MASRNAKGPAFKVYVRDCPATGLAADLAPFTHPTKTAATKAGRAGNFAYKPL